MFNAYSLDPETLMRITEESGGDPLAFNHLLRLAAASGGGGGAFALLDDAELSDDELLDPELNPPIEFDDLRQRVWRAYGLLLPNNYGRERESACAAHGESDPRPPGKEG